MTERLEQRWRGGGLSGGGRLFASDPDASAAPGRIAVRPQVTRTTNGVRRRISAAKSEACIVVRLCDAQTRHTPVSVRT